MGSPRRHADVQRRRRRVSSARRGATCTRRAGARHLPRSLHLTMLDHDCNGAARHLATWGASTTRSVGEKTASWVSSTAPATRARQERRASASAMQAPRCCTTAEAPGLPPATGQVTPGGEVLVLQRTTSTMTATARPTAQDLGAACSARAARRRCAPRTRRAAATTARAERRASRRVTRARRPARATARAGEPARAKSRPCPKAVAAPTASTTTAMARSTAQTPPARRRWPAARCARALPSTAPSTRTRLQTCTVINPTGWTVTHVGAFANNDDITDIAVTPDGNLYGISYTALYSIDKTTAHATYIADVSGSANNGLTFLPNGNLLAADTTGDMKRIEPRDRQRHRRRQLQPRPLERGRPRRGRRRHLVWRVIDHQRRRRRLEQQRAAARRPHQRQRDGRWAYRLRQRVGRRLRERDRHRLHHVAGQINSDRPRHGRRHLAGHALRRVLGRGHVAAGPEQPLPVSLLTASTVCRRSRCLPSRSCPSA